MSTTQTTLPKVSLERCRDLLQQMVRIRSVLGEDTNAYLWVTENLKALGMKVEHYPVEGRKVPLVLGVLEGDSDVPGVLFDAHFDTVHAVAQDWSRDPWSGEVVDGVLYGRGAVDSQGGHVAMYAAVEALVSSGAPRRGPIYFVCDSDGEGAFRGASLMSDLGIVEKVGTVFSAEATSNEGVEIAYPGISTWKVTAVGRTAHPTEPEKGINAITKMAKLIEAVDEGRLQTPQGTSKWFEPRVTIQAIRTKAGGGWVIPGRCDAVVSVLSPAGVGFQDIESALAKFLRELEREDGEVKFELKVIPMGAGRLWLRPGESDPEAPGVKATLAAINEVRGKPGEVRRFNGGYVDGAEFMRPGPSGYSTPTVITFGPGDFEQAHQVDEHISVDEVRVAADIFARATLELLS